MHPHHLWLQTRDIQKIKPFKFPSGIGEEVLSRPHPLLRSSDGQKTQREGESYIFESSFTGVFPIFQYMYH